MSDNITTSASHPDDMSNMLRCDRNVYSLSEFFKVLGDTTRMRILCSLFDNEMCVCDISKHLSMTPSAISHQLKVLKNSNLVDNRREGKTVYYFLADDHVRTILHKGYEHMTENKNKD